VPDVTERQCETEATRKYVVMVLSQGSAESRYLPSQIERSSLDDFDFDGLDQFVIPAEL